jgi:hypothetical protein
LRGLGLPFWGCEAPGKGYPLGVLSIQVLGGPDLLCRTLSLLGEFIRCQSDDDDYACFCGGVAMLGGDRIDTSTRVPAARHVWAHVVMPCLVQH